MDHVAVHLRQGHGPTALFLHANGVPPLAYRPFLEALSTELDVVALGMRPLLSPTPTDPRLPWKTLAHDALDWAERQRIGPFVAIGHSMGATAWIQALAERAGSATGLVVIEPAMVRPWQALALRLVPGSLADRFTPAGSTRRKRDRWADEAAFRASCARSGLYDGLGPDELDAFVAAAVHDGPDGKHLVFPKAWEAHFYNLAPCPYGEMGRLSLPLVALRGAASIYLDDARWSGLLRRQPDAVTRQRPELGHLMPLEAPVQVAHDVLDGLRAHGLLPATSAQAGSP
jgi:pimeloyl-ACP methyl ester carboxylesterase